MTKLHGRKSAALVCDLTQRIQTSDKHEHSTQTNSDKGRSTEIRHQHHAYNKPYKPSNSGEPSRTLLSRSGIVKHIYTHYTYIQRPHIPKLRTKSTRSYLHVENKRQQTGAHNTLNNGRAPYNLSKKQNLRPLPLPPGDKC